MLSANFHGLRVLALESRHAKEMSRLISTYGGQPVVAPALREVPLDSNSLALEFARGLVNGEFDAVIFMTGAGLRALVRQVESIYPRDALAGALRRTTVVARGPKPVSALGELGVKPALVAPEPNTWREILGVLDGDAGSPLAGRFRVAVQEYGVPCPELLSGLKERGAQVTRVPVYKWSLPEDTSALLEAAKSAGRGEIAVILFTTATQVAHFLQVAAEAGLEQPLRNELERMVVASIGPTTSEYLRSVGLHADVEASHPRMGFLVKEAAERSAAILREKQGEPGLDFLHEIGRRMAAGGSLREVLQSIVEFCAMVVQCDSCFLYVLEGDELVLRASRNPHPEEIGFLKLRLGEGITGWVAKHRQPVAVARNAFHDPRFQFFNELPEDRYEAFLSVPILSCDRLTGVINLQHREPHFYTRREIRLISTIGFLVGAEIERARLEEKTSKPSEELDARKTIERATGILQHELHVTEQEAHFSLRRQSRRMRKTMKEVAEAVVTEDMMRSRNKTGTSAGGGCGN
jgi:uroporphyrinogen-III synthase